MGRCAALAALAGVALTACGGPEARGRPPVSDVRFDELSGDVWAFERRVRGRAPEGCVTVEIKRGPVLLRAPVSGGRFSAVVPLSPGDNVVSAFCADPAEASRAARVVYRVPLSAAPRAAVRFVALASGAFVLDGAASEPNAGTDLPLSAFGWSGDPSNPAPLTTSSGAPIETVRAPRVRVAVPSRPGEYVAWLTVGDSSEVDRAGIAFTVEGGAARPVDRQRTSPGWIDEAVVYAPSDEPALDALRAQLPRLAELGISALVLRPRLRGPLRAADPPPLQRAAWAPAELRALVDAAHRLGMRVLIALAPGRTARAHPYLVHASRHRARSPYWSLYEREGPRLDYDNPDVRRWMLSALASWTRALDVDGFRIEEAAALAARAPGFILTLREELARIDPNVALIADAGAPLEVGFDARASAPSTALLALEPEPRVLRGLDPRVDAERLRVATTWLFTAPGIPLVRAPLALGGEPARIVRTLARLRHREAALQRGRFIPLEVRGAGARAFARVAEGERPIVVVLALGARPIRARVRLPRTLRGHALVPLLGEGPARLARGRLVVRLGPHDARVFALE